MKKEKYEELAKKFLDEIDKEGNASDMMEIAELMKRKAYSRKLADLA